MPVFYDLPAGELVAGLSTDDGQDVLDVAVHGGSVSVTVYTPRPDDADADADNRSAPESRIHDRGSYVGLAVFPNTPTDLSQHPKARNRRLAGG